MIYTGADVLDCYHKLTKQLIDEFGYGAELTITEIYPILDELNSYLPSNASHFSVDAMIDDLNEIGFVKKITQLAVKHHIKNYRLPKDENQFFAYYIGTQFN